MVLNYLSNAKTKHRTQDAGDILSRGLDSLSIQDVEGVTPRLGEALIADQLNKLSTNEREHVILEIHGVAELVKETPEFVQDSLTKMQHALDCITLTLRGQRQQNRPQSERFDGDMEGPQSVKIGQQRNCPSAYERALAMVSLNDNSGSSESTRGTNLDIRSSEFRLSFLRAERFQPKAAAERMLRYFEEKERLFGTQLLARVVKMKDLDEESLGCLQCGRIQLAGKDTQGRAIMIGLRKLVRDIRNLDSLLRVFWYLCSVASEDIETQKRGMVFIMYCLGSPFAPRTQIYGLGRVLQVLPVRAASIHACCDDAVTQAAATVASLLIGVNNTIRVRCHSGSDLEVQYKLMTFGIPTNLLPVSITGEIDIGKHLNFLKERNVTESLQDNREENDVSNQSEQGITPGGGSDAGGNKILAPLQCHPQVSGENNIAAPKFHERESTLSDISEVVLPSKFDVVLGRGKGLQNHEGNLRYRDIVERNRHAYECTTQKGGKSRIIKSVVQQIYASGGQFLREDAKGTWIAVDDKQAEDKVSHSFRNQKRLSLKASTTHDAHFDADAWIGSGIGSSPKRQRIQIHTMPI